ncbi:hypothetical protein OTU49_014479, partial [Cherax quadricarinatus]
VLLPRETDPILHMGCPLAASTPTARTSTTQPTVYAHYAPEHTTLLPSYTHDLSTTLPRSYPREPSSGESPYTRDVLASLSTPYSHHSFTLGRTGSLSSGRATPPCSSTTTTTSTTTSSPSSVNHHGSTSTVAFQLESDSPRIPLVNPRDKAGSPNHRESSV